MMAQIAAAEAEDLQKMTAAKLGTLSLVLSHVYASRGDKGLNMYARNITDFEQPLEYASKIPLDTPLLFPERLHATTLLPGSKDYHWVTNFEDSIFVLAPPIPERAESLTATQMMNFTIPLDSTSDASMEDIPDRTTTPAYLQDFSTGPSMSPGKFEYRLPTIPPATVDRGKGSSLRPAAGTVPDVVGPVTPP
jgi:hypothetical protein